jgi:hypothetical protein
MKSDLLTTTSMVNAVWDEALATHSGTGTAGKALSDAGTSSNPWTTSLPGAYATGTAGQILGSLLDTSISTRATGSVWTQAIANNIDTTISSRASASLWTSTVAGRIDTNITGAVSAASLALIAAGMATLTANVDTTVSSRASASLWTSTVAGRIDTSISAGFAALNNITVAQVLAGVVDGSFTVSSTLKEILAYVTGQVTKTSDSYAYATRAGSLLFTNTVTSGGRTRT